MINRLNKANNHFFLARYFKFNAVKSVNEFRAEPDLGYH